MASDTVGSIDEGSPRYGRTDDERQLRDLAYPLIQPPFDRSRWYSIIGEYGATRIFPREYFDRTAYSHELMARPYRSAAGRYAQLVEDIRNDIVRVGPFFRIAARVVDLDHKRQLSLAYVSDLQGDERGNALRRVGENNLIVSWVDQSLVQRVAAYRYALERLVIAYPSPMAVEAERVLNQLQMKIGENRLGRG
jgi:hypothetical protein